MRYAKRLNTSIFIKKCFLFTVGSVCHVKWFIIGLKNCQLGSKHFADDKEVETEVRKWLRQQAKDFYAADFDILVKRWDNCINVVKDMSRNKCFFPVSNIACFTFYIHL
jgi:hypothetical protein